MNSPGKTNPPPRAILLPNVSYRDTKGNIWLGNICNIRMQMQFSNKIHLQFNSQRIFIVQWEHPFWDMEHTISEFLRSREPDRMRSSFTFFLYIQIDFISPKVHNLNTIMLNPCDKLSFIFSKTPCDLVFLKIYISFERLIKHVFQIAQKRISKCTFSFHYFFKMFFS